MKTINFNFLNILLILLVLVILGADYYYYLNYEDYFLFISFQIILSFCTIPLFIYLEDKYKIFTKFGKFLTKNRTIRIGKFLILLLFLNLTVSCKETKPTEIRCETIVDPRFKLGDIAYLKPDSSKVIIDEVRGKYDKGVAYDIRYLNKNNKLESELFIYEYMFY